MKFEIITLFPDYFREALKQSLIGKAAEKKLFEIEIVNLRDFATDKHHTVDDTPFGGGGGMVMMLQPLDNCLKSLGYSHKSGNSQPTSFPQGSSGLMSIIYAGWSRRRTCWTACRNAGSVRAPSIVGCGRGEL